MRRILLIAWRDYIATVRTKSFLIGLLLVPLLLVGGGAVLGVLTAFMVITGDTDDKHFAVIDRTAGAKLFAELETAAERRNELQIVHGPTGRRLRPKYILE